MPRKKKVVDEIFAVRERRKTNLPSGELFFRLIWIEDAYKNRDKNDKELLRYFPIAIIACIETFFRLIIKQIIDYGDPYLTNSQSIMPKNNVSFDVLKALHGQKITIGDVISHSISISSLEHIVSNINKIMEFDFLKKLSLVRDRWAVEIESKPDKPMLSNPNEIFKYVSRTFELRHIFCHETASNHVFEIEEVEKCYENSIKFLKASNELIHQILYPKAPLTQTEMNIASYDKYSLEKERLNSLMNNLKQCLSEKQLINLNSANDNWQKYLESSINLEGLRFEGGTIRPLIESQAAIQLTKGRIKYLRNFLESLEEPEINL